MYKKHDVARLMSSDVYIYILDKIDIVENISVVVSIDCNVNKTRQLVRLSGLLTSTHLHD